MNIRRCFNYSSSHAFSSIYFYVFLLQISISLFDDFSMTNTAGNSVDFAFTDSCRNCLFCVPKFAINS